MATANGTPSGPSRREFLKSSAAVVGAAAGLLASGDFAHAAGRESRAVIIGEGKHRYAADHNWARLPPGKRFGYTHGVIEDSKGRIFIANQSPDAIMVFDADGNFLNSWGAAYEKGAHGLTLLRENGEEILILANTKLAEVVKTTLEGDVIWRITTPDLPDIYTDEKKFSPTETAVGPDGRVYVADGYGQSWVHIYDRDGKYLHSFGGPGEGEENLNQPHGISIDWRSGDPVVQVSDRQNVRIANFTLDGDYIETVIPPSELRFPCTTIQDHGELYIPDLFARVSIFDKDNKKIIDLGDYVDGKPLTQWSDFGTTYPDLKGYPNIPHEKRIDGKFSSPHGLRVDHLGNVYVVEWIEDGRVTKLTRVEG
ncbi:MAG TPA: 6-bladed beta-propeller [Rhodothermales bacterium]|nr:6-bladed beta-propeller [Rhodothermales bacterium]